MPYLNENLKNLSVKQYFENILIWKLEKKSKLSINNTAVRLFIIFTLPYRAWSSIVIVHEKSGFCLRFFEISKKWQKLF